MSASERVEAAGVEPTEGGGGGETNATNDQ
jgi:hypothetical protein